MNTENPNHILQQQEQYQAAVRNATKFLHSAILDAQLTVSQSLQFETPNQDSSMVQEDLIAHSLKNPASVVDIVDSAFQKAKAILNDASMNNEASQILDESSHLTLEPKMPTLPGLPNTEMATQILQPDTETPDDLLSQNMKWMDTSMLQLFESIQNQPEPK